MEYYLATDGVKEQYQAQAKPQPPAPPENPNEKKAAMYKDLYESIQFFDSLFLEALQEGNRLERLVQES